MNKQPRRALIVIDVQNEYVCGNLPIEYPAPGVSLRNIGRAMDAARAARVPVVVVQNTAPAGAPIFDKGTPGWELHETVAQRGHDHYIEKTLPSCFAGTDLGQWLADHRIDTLAVIGYMTHNCVAATVMHALHAGLAVEVLDDATGSLPYANDAGEASARQIHEAFTVVFQSRFAAVLSTAGWIRILADGGVPSRDSIFGSNQRARASRALRSTAGA
jgi:nicotinamidase-related amidase